MAETIRELQVLSTEQLIQKHDEIAAGTTVGTNHYLAELARRDQQQTNCELLRLSRTMTRLTWVITFATIINVILVCVPLFR